MVALDGNNVNDRRWEPGQSLGKKEKKNPPESCIESKLDAIFHVYSVFFLVPERSTSRSPKEAPPELGSPN
jgi:hypothetical protein